MAKKTTDKELSISEKKEYAKLLYTQMGITVQKELASRVKVSAQTINKWVNEEEWELLRASMIMTKEAELRRLYRRLTYLNDTIELREKEEKGKPITAPEADTISKLSKAIADMEAETSIKDAMNVLKNFINFVKHEDFNQAKVITAAADPFIKSLMPR